MKFKFPALMGLALILLNSETVNAAPVPPDAGQVTRELQKPTLVAPQAPLKLRVDENATNKNARSDVRFMVKAIRISGNSVIAESELEALVADLLGAEHSLAELDAGAARITAYYRARDYVVARAYLPAQEIKDGVVNIAVIEGRIDKQRLNNQSRLSDARANEYLSHVREGAPVAAAPVDRALLLMSDTPGVGGARATLQPGASVGTSDLVVGLEPGAPYSGSVELDNYGNRYTGEYRLGGNFKLNSPLGIGDQLTLRALVSDQNLSYGRLAYQVPIGGDGLRLGAAYSDTHYRLGKDFAILKAHGTATSSSVFAIYPFVRSQLSNLSGTFTWEEKKLNDVVDATATVTGKRVQLANLGLTGNNRDTLGGGGISAVDLSLATGRLDIDSPSALFIDSLSARTNGAYARLAYNASRLQRLTSDNVFYASLSGQAADKNLDSSEKFSLGGASGVRAYPQGEAIGDEGTLVNLELRHNFTETIQGLVFYDTGSITINRKPFGPPANNSRTLSGAGIGANTTMATIQIKVYVAWRTHGGQSTSEPASVNRNPRSWLQASMPF